MRACVSTCVSEVQLQRLGALKAGTIRRRREKTFIVYECSVWQVLSGENREVRSGFEVSGRNIPPPFSLFGLSAHSRSLGHSTKAGFDICNVRHVRKMYRTFLCLSAKGIFEKNAWGELWPCPAPPSPTGP